MRFVIIKFVIIRGAHSCVLELSGYMISYSNRLQAPYWMHNYENGYSASKQTNFLRALRALHLVEKSGDLNDDDFWQTQVGC